MVVSYYCRWKGAEDVVLTFGMASLTDTQVYHLHGTYIYICTTLIILSIKCICLLSEKGGSDHGNGDTTCESYTRWQVRSSLSHIPDGRLISHFLTIYNDIRVRV